MLVEALYRMLYCELSSNVLTYLTECFRKLKSIVQNYEFAYLLKIYY